MVQQMAVVVVAMAVLTGLVAADPGCYSCSYSSHSGHPGKSGHSGYPSKFGHSSQPGNFGHSSQPGNFGHSSQPGNFGHPGKFSQGGRPGGHRSGTAGALAQAGSFAFSSSGSFSSAQSHANSNGNSHALSFASSQANNHGLNTGRGSGGSGRYPGSHSGGRPGGRPSIGHPTGCPNCGCGGCGGSCGWCGGNYGRKKRSIDGMMNNTNVQSLYDTISSEDKDQCGLRLVCELAQRDPRDLAEDEVQILLPYRGAGESDGSKYGQYDEAAWHGQEGHSCPQHYRLCTFTAEQIMDEYRKEVAASVNDN